MQHRTTIEDIAKELGISASTVSRALKDHPDISQETKQKVLETAKKLKYLPNRFAINLKKKQFRTIGIIAPEITHFFFSSVIKGVEDVAFENNYSVVLALSNESYEIEKKNINILIESGVAGILISKTKESKDFSHIMELINYDIPVVFYDRFFKNLKTTKVIINDEYAAYLAVEYLIKTGCKNIIMYNMPQDTELSKRRKNGYVEALKNYKIPYTPKKIIGCDTYIKAVEITEKLIKENVKFDAIFAVNDNTAIGAIEVLKKYKISIPEEVSVIGFGNDFVSEICEPKLTTVEQNGYEMGKIAAKLLIEAIDDENKAKKAITEVIPVKLIVRESTRKI